jgi:3D (Asp-Asp-Asp) domain-containing protein
MKSFLLTMVTLALSCSWGNAAVPRKQSVYRVEATAFDLKGITRAGTVSHGGVVAADPAFLPLGTRIRVTGAGRYSGVYLIADTGNKVAGRHIDIYVPGPVQAKQFGKKIVTVSVLKWGQGVVSGSADRTAAKAAPPVVKRGVHE